MPISPNQGSTSGGTTVTITGVNLANATSVHFGPNLATITANTPTMVTVVNPSGCGAVPVTVTTGGGTSNFLYFYYISPPIVTELDPNSGSVFGGNTVTFTGFNLLTSINVSFGGNNATPTIINDSTIQVVAPAGANPGSVPVVITSAGGVASGFTYNYIDAPTVISLSPVSGPADGGTSVTITGTNLSTTTNVTFGGISSAFSVINSTTVSVVTPPGSVGAVDVVITTTAGSATLVGGFTYIAGPGI